MLVCIVGVLKGKHIVVTKKMKERKHIVLLRQNDYIFCQESRQFFFSLIRKAKQEEKKEN
jgi:hypothetical protein